MATTRTFQDMLNEYLTYDLLREELVKRDYVLMRVEKDNGWKGGTLPVPFKAAGGSSVKWAGLTAANDVAEDQFIRGSISAYKEVWGTMIFNSTDFVQHDGRINEDSFLSILPESVDDFMEYFKQVVSIQLTTGPNFATALADGGADGTVQVDRCDRFSLGQKVNLDDDNTAAAAYYVIAIDVNNGVAGSPGSGDITLSATRGGAAADISAFTTAENAKFYHDGADVGGTTVFTSLKSQLLSAANGGSANLFGKSKLAYPFLQAVNVDGSAITAANILEKIFDAYVQVRAKAKGKATDVLMSWKHLGSIMKLIEVQKGAFKVSEGSEKASEYGWTTIEITSVSGSRLKFVGIQEMDDDVIFFMDWSAVKLHTNGMIRKHKTPEGLEYYTVRATTGYSYLIDIYMFGELAVNKPGHCGVLHTISY